MKKILLICTILTLGLTVSTKASVVIPTKSTSNSLSLAKINLLKPNIEPFKKIEMCTQYGFEVNQYGSVKVYEVTAATCAEAMTALAIIMM